MRAVMRESCAAQGCRSLGGWGSGGAVPWGQHPPEVGAPTVAAHFIPAREHDLDVPTTAGRVASHQQFWPPSCRARKHGLQAWGKGPAGLPSPPFSRSPPPMLQHRGTACSERVLAVTN